MLHSSTAVVAVPASQPGALAGFVSSCSCGLVMRSSLRTLLEADRAEHAAYHARRAARVEQTRRDFVALGPEAALRRAAA